MALLVQLALLGVGCASHEGSSTTTGDSGVLSVSVEFLAAGGERTCAVKNDDTVWCWGLDGIPVTKNPTPVAVVGLSRVTVVTTGGGQNCAIKNDGTVWCWGNIYRSHQQGDDIEMPETFHSLTPVVVAGLSGATAVAAGSGFTCAVKNDGTVWCWGENGGYLGDGTTTESSTPVTVAGLSGAAAVVSGGSHTCAVKHDGAVWCWGDNRFGQLGNGMTSSIISSTPVAVVGLSGATAVAVGAFHTCAVKSDGTVWCWGENGSGQLGDDTTTESSTPVAVVGFSGATAATAGAFHTCAVKGDGTVWCWGLDGITATESPTPVAVVGLSDVITVSAGDVHTCAVKNDGTAWCWGLNDSGQLGDGTTTDSPTPVAVSGFAAL